MGKSLLASPFRRTAKKFTSRAICPTGSLNWTQRPEKSCGFLATDAAKGVGFLEVPAGSEKEFLKDRPVQEMSGIAKNNLILRTTLLTS